MENINRDIILNKVIPQLEDEGYDPNKFIINKTEGENVIWFQEMDNEKTINWFENLNNTFEDNDNLTFNLFAAKLLEDESVIFIAKNNEIEEQCDNIQESIIKQIIYNLTNNVFKQKDIILNQFINQKYGHLLLKDIIVYHILVPEDTELNLNTQNSLIKAMITEMTQLIKENQETYRLTENEILNTSVKTIKFYNDYYEIILYTKNKKYITGKFDTNKQMEALIETI